MGAALQLSADPTTGYGWVIGVISPPTIAGTILMTTPLATTVTSTSAPTISGVTLLAQKMLGIAVVSASSTLFASAGVLMKSPTLDGTDLTITAESDGQLDDR